ncbi:ERAP1 family protein [Megaselia abdita]
MSNDPDLDDVAFLSGGESTGGRQTRNGVAVCSQKRALCVTGAVLGCLLGIALIIAFAGTASDCSCSGKLSSGLVPEDDNDTEPFNPIATNGEPFPYLENKLPSYIRPLRYVVTIHPNLTTFDVKGQVTIDLYIEKETSFVVINIQDLNVTEKAIVPSGTSKYALKIVKVLEYPPRQQLYIEMKEKLKKKTNYTLNLRWYSKLNPEPEGFYVDYYDHSDNFQKPLAATVLKPGGARRAFPCFDEPHLRAPFRVSVFRDRFHMGLSNTVVHTTDDVGFYMGTGLLRDDFSETPPMTADAITWVVSDFQTRSLGPSAKQSTITTITTAATPKAKGGQKTSPNKNVKNVTILTHMVVKNPMVPKVFGIPTNEKTNTSSVIKYGPVYTFYAQSDLLDRSDFILNTSRSILEYLQTWLNVTYPLSKIDFVALPSLKKDAVSTLGLITLRTAFLNEKSAFTTESYHTSALKLAEAIIKQFFGGMTSPKTLKDLWLWDGLIKYLSTIILSPLKPNWPLDDKYLLHTTTMSLDIDAIQGWISIINGTNHDGINEDFYVDKTASIFAMMHASIGDDKFRSCLGHFLKINKFKTAEPLDLWNICTKKSNGSKNIKEMMSLWTHQAGFPLLTVVKRGNSVTITQSAFKPAEFKAIYDDNYDGNNYYNYTPPSPTAAAAAKSKLKPIKWIFPITYITDNNTENENLWMQNYDITFQVPDGVKWIKINSGQNGYYRVLYDDSNWNNIIDDLRRKHKSFSTKDRIGLLSDAFTLCHANLLNCEITMNMVLYLPKETNWAPVTIALKHLEKWRRILKYSECFLMLSEFVKTKLRILIDRVGWEDKGTDEERLLRSELLLASVLWEDSDSINKAKSNFNQLSNSTIPPNLKEVIYTGAILSGEYSFWMNCWQRFTSIESTSDAFIERMQLLRALGRTKDAWLQNRLLSYATMLPTSEVVVILKAIAGTPTGGAMACRFLQAKWFDLQARLGQGSLAFAKVISSITQYGATKFDYDELNSLVHRFGRGPGNEILNMTLSTVAANVEWVARSQNTLFKWVENSLHAH